MLRRGEVEERLIRGNWYSIAQIEKERMSDDRPIDAILKERGSNYGDFTNQAVISQGLENYMRSFDGWELLSAHQKEGLKIIVHKIARILNGNPNFKDSWTDIAGYAKLCADRCLEPEPE